MQEIAPIIGQLGFPIAVASILIFKITAQLESIRLEISSVKNELTQIKGDQKTLLEKVEEVRRAITEKI